MIVIRLAGGLGNQIFQLGVGLLFAKRSRIKKIIIDNSSLKSYKTKRECELLKFFDFSKLCMDIELKNLLITKLRLPKFFPIKMSKYPFVGDKNFTIVMKNPNKKNLFLDGYFQHVISQDEFDEILNILRIIFIKKSVDSEITGCAVHIRGSDFVKLGWNSVTPKAYYKKAINLMSHRYKQNKFYIFTDDKGYSKNTLEDLNILYEFSRGTIYEDFYSLGSFKYRILSSSTFALWASALGDNVDSVVIAPKYWIPNKVRKILLPKEIRIDI